MRNRVKSFSEIGFPEEDDPWIAKFMMETSIPEEYDPITVQKSMISDLKLESKPNPNPNVLATDPGGTNLLTFLVTDPGGRIP